MKSTLASSIAQQKAYHQTAAAMAGLQSNTEELQSRVGVLQNQPAAYTMNQSMPAGSRSSIEIAPGDVGTINASTGQDGSKVPMERYALTGSRGVEVKAVGNVLLSSIPQSSEDGNATLAATSARITSFEQARARIDHSLPGGGYPLIVGGNSMTLPGDV